MVSFFLKEENLTMTGRFFFLFKTTQAMCSFNFSWLNTYIKQISAEFDNMLLGFRPGLFILIFNAEEQEITPA